jgi:eukaryotic-like serine/threonine-protein kinase
MPEIGQQLLHYSITGKIGKGGMGEVYQAKDRKLGRDVAIKVLPEEFARDTDRVARFQREAKLLASLNHPNIAAIHGLEESGGMQFLVLELVEGETLANQIKRGPIPVEEAMKLALQITEALEAAHERGVIHRDLKPANIKITPEGKVKVLDFGLAKAFAGEQAAPNLSNSPTLSDMATQQGVILGTAAYMSPEQARGKPVDKGADIWAFGVVLCEMLTAQSLFAGDDVSQTLARVLERQPDFSLLPPGIHPRVRLMLERCLEKAPRNRYGSINDARVDIEKALADPGEVLAQPVPARESPKTLRTMIPWIAAALMLGVVVAGAVIWNLRVPELRQIVRFNYELPEGQEFTGDCPIDISHDGKKIVYSTSKGLYLHSMDDLEAKLVRGTSETAENPFFSPDGKWIGFFSSADKKLKKIPVSGGAPVAVADVSPLGFCDWNEDGTIVYGQRETGIMRISENGGTPESLVKKPDLLDLPRVLPDGKSLMYTTSKSGNRQPRIMVKPLKSGEPKELLPGWLCQYLATGHIIYWPPDEGTLYAVPFNPDRLEVAGEPVRLVDGVGNAAISDSGTLVYIPDTQVTVVSGVTLVWVDREGKEEPLGAPPNSYAFPRISPDGTRVAFNIFGENRDIWTWDLIRKTMTRLTFDKSADISPIWTPDSKRIFFASNREGKACPYWKAADGTGEEEKLGSNLDLISLPYGISNDGKLLLIAENNSGNWQIGVLSLEGNRIRKPLLNSPGQGAAFPSLSPNNKWLAYAFGESDRPEIYVCSFPDVSKGKLKISSNGGTSPLWSPDGRELFYLSEDDMAVTAVAVNTGEVFSAEIPKKLFSRSPYLNSGPGVPWDIHPDGKRFLMMKHPDSAASAGGQWRRIHVVLNWFEELKQKVPTK